VKILCYGENSEWIKYSRIIIDKLGGYPYCVTPSRELAEESSKYFEETYFFNGGVYEPSKYCRAILEVAGRIFPDVSLFPSTIKGRTIAGLYAGARDESIITDIVDVDHEDSVLKLKRLVYGGSCIATIKSTLPATLCITPGTQKPPETSRKGSIEELRISLENRITVSLNPRVGGGPPLEKSDLVVAAGRGFKNREDLEMVRELVSLTVNSAWSVTRPLAAEYGWADNWIGISGVTVNPRIYLAVGVSGQPLHMVGARNSKIIIAINKDPNAPISQEADYFIVGDLYKILPKLIEKIKTTKTSST